MADGWESYFEKAAKAAEGSSRRARNVGEKAKFRAARKKWSSTMGPLPEGESIGAAAKAARAARSAPMEPAWDAKAVAWLARSMGHHGKGLLMGAAPILIPLLTKMATGYASDVAEPISHLMRGAPLGKPSLDAMLQMQAQAEEAAMHQNIQDQEIQKLAAVNEQRLMTMAPQLANQLLAGRRLPQGALVIGGQQRTDLLRQFATQMATNPAYAQDPTGGSEQFLGGQPQ